MTLRQQDPFRDLSASQQEPRSSGQNLPRLQDILAPRPLQNEPLSNWSPANGPAYHSANHSYGSSGHLPWHPPAVQNGQDSTATRHILPASRSNLSTLDTHGTRPQEPPHSNGPVYSAYVTSARDAHDHQREVLQHSSPAAPIHAPYPPTPGDQSLYRNAMTSMERAAAHGLMHQGQEISQLKYITTEDIPGQGKFHVYQDGIRIPAEVDGDPVNPAWGLTKANKPRKRMPKACLDCREKKVKCDPGTGDTCVQCERAKRLCRKEQPTQMGAMTAGSPPTWPRTTGLPHRQCSVDHTTVKTQDGEVETLGKRRPREDRGMLEFQNKKQRSMSPPAQHVVLPPKRVDSVNHGSPPAPISPRRTLCIDEDPCAMDPQGAFELMELFFENVNDSTYFLFPHTYFGYWAKTSPEKTYGERLVLYSMLALGSIFVPERLDADHQLDDRVSRMGKLCAQIATDVLSRGSNPPSILTAQARLLMALYQHAQGCVDIAAELLGAAISTLTLLRYNIESACTSMTGHEQGSTIQYEYRFDPFQLAECRRRTTWTAFMIERYFDTSFFNLQTQDILVRLPCADQTYEQGRQPSNALFLAPACNDEKAVAVIAHPLASLIPVLAIWSDASTFVAREQHSGREHYIKTYQDKCSELNHRLQQWYTQLPEHLLHRPTNLERSIHGRYAIPYITMLTLYYATSIKLCRYYKHQWLPQLRPQLIPKVHESAHYLLGLIKAFTEHSTQFMMRPQSHGMTNPIAAAPPFIGYAIHAAADILGAGGMQDSMTYSLEMIGAGMNFLQEMYKHWSSAQPRFFDCRKRYYQIRNLVQRPIRSPSGCWIDQRWGMEAPLDTTFPLDYDCIYGMGSTSGYDPAFYEAFDRAPPLTLRN